MNHETRHPSGDACPSTSPSGLAFGLERLTGPRLAQRLFAPDEPGGGGQTGTPRGVPLPGLAAARQRLGLSQAELAARSGVSEKTISRLEHGGHAHYTTLERLRRALRVSRQRLLCPPQQNS